MDGLFFFGRMVWAGAFSSLQRCGEVKCPFHNSVLKKVKKRPRVPARASTQSAKYSQAAITASLKMTYAHLGQTRLAFLFCTTGEPVGWGGAVPSGIQAGRTITTS